MATSRTKTKAKAIKETSATELLDQIGTTSAPASKSNTPVVSVTDQKQLKVMQAIIEAKRNQSDAMARLKTAEADLRDKAVSYYETRCREDGTLHTSIRLVGELETDGGSEVQSLSFTQTRKCWKMTEKEASDPLRSLFADEFDNLFGSERTIAIDLSIISDKQLSKLIEKMMEALGDSFDSAVTVDRLIVPKEAFYGRRILDDKIRKIAARAQSDGYAVPNKPFFKAS